MVRRNFFNTAIIVIAIILVLLIGYRYATTESETLHFSGPNIYRAVYAYEVMHEQGFEVNLEFEGKWTDSGELATGSGIVLEAGEGKFVIDYQNSEISVGGPTSGAEHVGAATIILTTTHASVIKLGLEPRSSGDLDSLVSELNSLAERLVTPQSIGIAGEIMLDSETLLKPTIIQEIDNILKPRNEITFFETGLKLSLENSDLTELAEVANLLKASGIGVSKAATSRMLLLVRCSCTLTEAELNEKIPEAANVYSLQLIKTPVQ
jgi:hypothetical protein|tara:strand:- start:1562 stop:2356 length:795 start_codon:yes stop_codon:yes gene_type:complete